MPPHIREHINVHFSDSERRQNALRVFSDFHEMFVTAPGITIDGFDFGPPDILGAVRAISDMDRDRGYVTIHHLRASHALTSSVVAIASSDGEATVAHAWSVSKVQLRDDVVWRDGSQCVHRESKPEEARGIFSLERTYYEGGQEKRLFAKVVAWENGGCEVYTPEVQGGVEVVLSQASLASAPGARVA